MRGKYRDGSWVPCSPLKLGAVSYLKKMGMGVGDRWQSLPQLFSLTPIQLRTGPQQDDELPKLPI